MREPRVLSVNIGRPVLQRVPKGRPTGIAKGPVDVISVADLGVSAFGGPESAGGGAVVDQLLKGADATVTAAVARPDARLADVDGAGETERLLVRRWGGAIGGVPARTLPELFARRAAARPKFHSPQPML